MSILVDRDILAAMERGSIIITPFDRKCLGTNSYDVHLASTLRVYELRKDETRRRHDHVSDPVLDPLDVREPRATIDFPIPVDGFVLQPGRLYLASTVEHTYSRDHVPILNGRSSLGRLGLSIHVTAGTGDVGFRGHWTMELFVIETLRIYAGIPIGQLLWVSASGEALVPYYSKPSAKYNDAGPLPQPSKLYEERS